IVRVVGCGLVSIAEVHAIFAGAHHAQSEPEMARDRFGLLERHVFVKSSSGSVSKAVDEQHAMLGLHPVGELLSNHPLPARSASQLKQLASSWLLTFGKRHHACLVSRISMASTYGSLRQRLALRSVSAMLPAHSARL